MTISVSKLLQQHAFLTLIMIGVQSSDPIERDHFVNSEPVEKCTNFLPKLIQTIQKSFYQHILVQQLWIRQMLYRYTGIAPSLHKFIGHFATISCTEKTCLHWMLRSHNAEGMLLRWKKLNSEGLKNDQSFRGYHFLCMKSPFPFQISEFNDLSAKIRRILSWQGGSQ